MNAEMEALIARVAALSPEEAEARRQAYLREKRWRRDLAKLTAEQKAEENSTNRFDNLHS